MKRALAIGVLALMGVTAAQAATISYTDSVALQKTNWSETLQLPQFNSALGTLASVSFLFGGNVSTEFSAESLDAAPATLTLTSAASLKFGSPLSAELTVSKSATQGVSAFDGVIDFGGTSGIGSIVVSESDSDTVTLLTGLGGFIGGGTLDIGVAATAKSTASGAGNLVTITRTNAGAEVTATYNCEPGRSQPAGAVSEPGTLALLGLCLAGLAASRRRRH